MVKHTVTYENFDGEKVTEDLYFNITKAELSELNFKYNGNLQEVIKKATDSKDAKTIYEVFKDILMLGYGTKEESNGKTIFVKTAHAAEVFTHTEAFSTLLFDLASNEELMTTFVTKMLPKND